MSLKVNVSGTWKYLSKAYVKVSDAWKPCTNIHVNINGTWKPLYSYKWSTGNWGTCSAECGGGTQTRTVTCQRYHASNSSLDIQTVEDSFCTKAVGTKPATSQKCNTQSCTECKIEVTNLDTSSYTCNGTETSIYTWLVSDITTGWGIPTVNIYWNGTSVIKNDVIINTDLLEYTSEGYLYTRSDLYGSCSSSSLIPPSTVVTSTYTYYKVCRVPV